MLLMIAVVLLALTIFVAFANGANDVSKGIATLVGSGVTNYRRAVAWGSLWKGGTDGVIWSALLKRVALPLAASPVIAVGLLLLVLPLLRPLIVRFDRYCVCVKQTTAVTPEG